MKKTRLGLFFILAFSLVLFLSGCSSTPTNQSPNANFSANPTSGEAPLEVTCDASNSSDPDGSIISYNWDFGDGSTGSGVSINHTFDSSGTYYVELTVTDNDGATDSTGATVSVSSGNDSDTKIEILNWQLEKAIFDWVKIVGEVKNVSGEKIDQATVSAKFFDSNGKRLDKSSDYFFDLSPGVTAHLEILSTAEYNKVDSVDVYVGDVHIW